MLMLLSGSYLSCSTNKVVDPTNPPVVEVPSEPTPAILITDATGLDYVKEAVGLANNCLKNPAFIKALNDFNEYTFTDQTPTQISKTAFEAKDSFTVKTYSYWNPFSSVLAYREGNEMFLRTQKLPRSVESIFQSIMHEYFHVLGYGHPFNYETGRENSVPYAVEKISLVCLD